MNSGEDSWEVVLMNSKWNHACAYMFSSSSCLQAWNRWRIGFTHGLRFFFQARVREKLGVSVEDITMMDFVV